MIGDCRESLGAQSLFVGLPGKFGERSGVPGAHGQCRASFGENQAGLEEKVQGVGMGVRGSAIVPQASEPKGISLTGTSSSAERPSSYAPPGTSSGAVGSWKAQDAPGPRGTGGLVLAAPGVARGVS